MDVRPAEQCLIDLAAELPAGRVLCNSAGRAQLAAVLAQRDPQAPVCCYFLDLYQLYESRRALLHVPANLQLICAADPPAGEVDLAAWCFTRSGDAELTRELLQAGHERLAVGGRMAVAIDNPKDYWLHEQLREMFDKVTRQPHDAAVVYLATKTKPLKKHKTYACEVALRDGERLVQLRTRPGVFSHREVDGGARALIKALDVQPQMRILDLGCGSGAVGIVAALRAEPVQVQATDSNPRAIEAVEWAAERNGVSNLTAAVDCDGSALQPGTFDLVLANPPYFSHFRIAALFVALAHRALKAGGRLQVVTKTPEWYGTNLKRFEQIESRAVGTYHVVSAVRT